MERPSRGSRGNTERDAAAPVLTRCSQLGITKVVQASSVNVVSLVWSVAPKLHYLPLDEDHPREPDEPYGLSKLCVVLRDLRRAAC